MSVLALWCNFLIVLNISWYYVQLQDSVQLHGVSNTSEAITAVQYKIKFIGYFLIFVFYEQ